jgi:lysosomal acid lipase/cholesteryl ester hydrolase
MLVSALVMGANSAGVIRRNILKEAFGNFELARLGQNEAQCDTYEFHVLFDQNKYVIDEYTTTTDDGYILRMFRVGLSAFERQKLSVADQSNISKPILMVHAMGGSSDFYFINGEKGSLGFYLVNKGYDVWTGDSRGTKFSKGHTNPDLSDKEFYDFSWQEMGKYDVPAFFRKILENYSDPDQKITYFGHSQGTTQMFISLLEPSSRPYVEKHLHDFVAIAPITYLNHVSYDALQILAKFEKIIKFDFSVLGVWDLFSYGCKQNSDAWVKMIALLCQLTGGFCNEFETVILGFDSKFDNIVNILPTITEHGPSGTTARAIDHYGQLIKGGKNGEPIFRKYDLHSAEDNMKAYGQDTPPDWDFSTWTAPVTLVQLDADTLGTQENTNNLLAALPKGAAKVRHILEWDHGTPLWAKDASPLFRIADEVLSTA